MLHKHQSKTAASKDPKPPDVDFLGTLTGSKDALTAADEKVLAQKYQNLRTKLNGLVALNAVPNQFVRNHPQHASRVSSFAATRLHLRHKLFRVPGFNKLGSSQFTEAWQEFSKAPLIKTRRKLLPSSILQPTIAKIAQLKEEMDVDLKKLDRLCRLLKIARKEAFTLFNNNRLRKTDSSESLIEEICGRLLTIQQTLGMPIEKLAALLLKINSIQPKLDKVSDEFCRHKLDWCLRLQRNLSDEAFQFSSS